MALDSHLLRSSLIALAALTLGYVAARSSDPVHAQSHNYQSQPRADEPLDFQLSGIGPTSALAVYNTTDHTLYVYQGITTGSSKINCSFGLRIARPGGPLERQNCAPGTLP